MTSLVWPMRQAAVSTPALMSWAADTRWKGWVVTSRAETLAEACDRLAQRLGAQGDHFSVVAQHPAFRITAQNLSHDFAGHANPRTDVSRLTPLCGNPQRARLAGILSHTAPLTRGIPVTRSLNGTPGH